MCWAKQENMQLWSDACNHADMLHMQWSHKYAGSKHGTEGVDSDTSSGLTNQ